MSPVRPNHISIRPASLTPCPPPPPPSRSAGERYRRECLAHGGGVPAHRIVSTLLRRDVTPAQLASSIVTDVISQRVASQV